MINFLDKLGISGGVDVFVSVSPVVGVEMLTLDAHGNVKSYAQLPLEYNEAQREINDYDTFADAVNALFEMRNIDPKRTNVYLNLPTVWFGIKEGLPLMLDDEAITNVIIGELDQAYVFKQKEATPCWFDALANQDPNARTIFYTAIQSEAIEKCKNIFTRLGANLVSITCSLISDLKGLYNAGVATELMNNDNAYWSLMIINNSGLQMAEMQGRKLLKFYEEPMPLKSYEGEEVYGALESALQIALMDSQSSALVVVSETDLVSAEILNNKLGFGGASFFVEDNTLKKEPLMKMSLNIVPQDQIKVSLASLSAGAPENLLPMTVNFLVASGHKVSKNDTIEIPIGKSVIKLTPLKATIIALVLLLLILGPILVTEITTTTLLTNWNTQNEELQAQVNNLDEQIKSYSNSDNSQFDPVKEIKKVLGYNKIKINTYNAIGDNIPRNIYLTYFTITDAGLIRIKGCANSVEEVYVFFKNLKETLDPVYKAGDLGESKLRLNKLDLKAGSLEAVVDDTISPLDESPYTFEITNMDENQLKTLMNSMMNQNSNNPPADTNGENKTQPTN